MICYVCHCTPAEVLARLEAIPARIAAALVEWSHQEEPRAMPTEDEWGPAQILAHLRASNFILASRVYMILARVKPPLPAFDERRWAEVAGYARRDVSASLQAYTLLRDELVAMVRTQASDAWVHIGMHEQRGPVTLMDAIVGLVDHEEEHCMQLDAAVRKSALR